MVKLLLLDKDGTLINPKSGDRFVQSPSDQEPIANVAATLDRYVADGWLPVIISNQGGVAAGHKSLEAAIAEMRYCLELFPAIKEAYFCPDFEGNICWIASRGEAASIPSHPATGSFRKPGPGMLRVAVFRNQEGGLTIRKPIEVLMVGDRPEDEAAAEAAGVDFTPAYLWRGEVIRRKIT